MYIKQVSVFLQNTKGRLSQLLSLFAENNINLRALSIADTNDYGVLRLIVSDPDAALALLQQEGCLVSISEVLAVRVDDTPGGLAKAVAVLTEAEISIEYIYAFLGQVKEQALVIIRVDDLDKSVAALNAQGLEIAPSAEVYTM